MDRKEEIIYAALELGAEHGLSNVSMQQIADKVGIKKPSLYNHFKSKEELVSVMYEHFRCKARQRSAEQVQPDIGELLKTVEPVDLLKMAAGGYISMSIDDSELNMLYRVLYSERTFDPNAAAILVEETNRMLIATKNLFYAMQVHGKLNFRDIDTAAEAFAFGLHGLMDYQMDCENSGGSFDSEKINRYIEWFCKCFGGMEK